MMPTLHDLCEMLKLSSSFHLQTILNTVSGIKLPLVRSDFSEWNCIRLSGFPGAWR